MDIQILGSGNKSLAIVSFGSVDDRLVVRKVFEKIEKMFKKKPNIRPTCTCRGNLLSVGEIIDYLNTESGSGNLDEWPKPFNVQLRLSLKSHQKVFWYFMDVLFESALKKPVH